MNFEDKYLGKFNFTKEQVEKNLKNALKDLDIARRDKILEVKFSYAYTAFIKSGITLLSYHRLRVKSQPGHHAKIIETLARMLNDESIADRYRKRYAFKKESGFVFRRDRGYGNGVQAIYRICR